MKLSIRKKGMFAYSVVFLVFSILFISNDISNNYWWYFTTWMIIIYICVNLGNFLYSMNRRPRTVQSVWKVIFPLIIISFILSIIIDEKYGKNSSTDDSLLVYIITAMIFTAVLLPAFIANFKLAYNKDLIL
jgi:hypothetical protein